MILFFKNKNSVEVYHGKGYTTNSTQFEYLGIARYLKLTVIQNVQIGISNSKPRVRIKYNKNFSMEKVHTASKYKCISLNVHTYFIVYWPTVLIENIFKKY